MMMGLREELDRAIGDAIRQQPAGLRAMTEGPQELSEPASTAMDEVLAAREALLEAAGRWDEIIRRHEP